MSQHKLVCRVEQIIEWTQQYDVEVEVDTPMLLEVPQLPGAPPQPPRATGGAPPPDSFAVVQLRCKNSTWTLAPFPNCFPIYEPFAVALPPGATQK